MRDAVAQGDIFTQIRDEGLHVFLEDPGKTLNSCKFNGPWLEEIYGSEVLALYGGQRICCSGSTLGDRESFLVYAGTMADEYLRLREELPPDRVHYLLHDQALHNYLLHSGILEKRLEAAGRKLFVHENGDGVLTMGYANDFRIAKPGTSIANADGSIPAILHQYDRFDSLREFFTELYSA